MNKNHLIHFCVYSNTGDPNLFWWQRVNGESIDILKNRVQILNITFKEPGSGGFSKGWRSPFSGPGLCTVRPSTGLTERFITGATQMCKESLVILENTFHLHQKMLIILIKKTTTSIPKNNNHKFYCVTN